MTSVTVAVSTFRESYFEWVMQLLDSLKNQTYKNFKVLLVVNGNNRYFEKLQNSIDNRIDLSFEVNVFFNSTERGIAYARNIALKNATTPYIAYTDDDAIPDPHWLMMANAVFENIKSVGAVTGPIVANWDAKLEDFASWFPKELYWIIGCTNSEFPTVKKVRNGFASNLFLDREAAIKCGGFNEEFGYKQKYRMAGEEPELCLRLKQLGNFTLWNPQLVVYHRIPASRIKFSNIIIRSYIEGRTKAHLKKHLGCGVTTVETQQMNTVLEAIIKKGSFKSKAYLALTSSAVASGYFITNANILLQRHKIQPRNGESLISNSLDV
jgi:glucosyl-dolichyl phosphate glucuronosyltransferase